jgi:hypothetical protein
MSLSMNDEKPSMGGCSGKVDSQQMFMDYNYKVKGNLCPLVKMNTLYGK